MGGSTTTSGGRHGAVGTAKGTSSSSRTKGGAGGGGTDRGDYTSGSGGGGGGRDMHSKNGHHATGTTGTGTGTSAGGGNHHSTEWEGGEVAVLSREDWNNIVDYFAAPDRNKRPGDPSSSSAGDMVDYHRFCDTVLNPEEIKLVLESWKAIAIREAQVAKHAQDSMNKGGGNGSSRGGGAGGGGGGGGSGHGRYGDTGGAISRSGPSGGSSTGVQKMSTKHHNSGSYY